jgi:hypothetical protein
VKSWEPKIPQPSKNKHVKRCYVIYTRVFKHGISFGGKVVWLTDKQLTFACIKYPDKEFRKVLERDRLEEYKKYLDATIE